MADYEKLFSDEQIVALRNGLHAAMAFGFLAGVGLASLVWAVLLWKP